MIYRAARIIGHSVAATIMIRGFINLKKITSFDVWMGFQVGGYWQFLTIDGLMIACAVMAGGLLQDITPRSMSEIYRAVSQIKRFLLLLALPISIVVASVYWPLILFAPHLMVAQEPVNQPNLDAPPPLFRIPLDIDIAMHGLPGPFLLLDFFLLENKFSKETVNKAGPILAAVIGSVYAVWVEYCASYNGFFPYPFLTVSTLPVRLIIYAICTMGSVLVFRGVNSLHP